MLLERVNLQTKLENLQKKEAPPEDLLAEVQKIIQAEEEKQQEVLQRLQESNGGNSNYFNLDLLPSNRIFHISAIQALCISYRLRFLNAERFRGEIPQEAVSAIRQVEKTHNTTLKNFHIMAPAEYFRLENADDPMLFAPIGNQYYFLVHKWGKDIHPMRKLRMWPLRHLENLIIFSFCLSFFLTFGIREIFFARFQATSEFLILFLYTFKSVIGLTLFYGISLGKNFSSGNWNSKFYNA